LIQPYCCTRTLFEKRHDDEAAAEGQAPGLQEEREELAEDGCGRRLGVDRDRDQGEERRRRVSAAEQRTVIEDAENPGADEEDRHLGLEPDRHDKADPGHDPLQPVFHPELGEAVAGMDDQRDDRRADPVEQRGHPAKAAKVHVERTERTDDQEIGQDEGPAAGPGSPEPAAHVGDENPDLDRQRPGQRLRYRDGVAHLLPGDPALVADQLLFHQPDQRHRAAKTDRPEPEEIKDDVPYRAALRHLGRRNLGCGGH
jgi:hypothetical protein